MSVTDFGLGADDPVSDQDIAALPPPAIPTSTSPIFSTGSLLDQLPSPDQSPDLLASVSPDPSSTPSPVRSPSSGRRLSRFLPFRRSSSTSKAMDSSTNPSTSAPVPPSSSPPLDNFRRPSAQNIKTPEPHTHDPHSLSPQPRPRTRTPSASPRTSIYGALSSPSSASNPADIFERSIESVPSVSTKSPSVKGVPTHQVLEDIIPPALEATATAFTDHVNPDDVEIVTFCEVASNDSRSNAGSPVPPASPVLSAPLEATQNPWGEELRSNSGAGSPDLEGKKRTLNLMSAVEHLADEIIHPTAPEPVGKKTHLPSPLSLSPTMSPADSASRVNPRNTIGEAVYMERSQSQASTIGDAMVIKQNMGDALRHQRLHGTGHNGEVSPSMRSPAVSPSPDPAVPLKKGDDVEVNPWNQ